MHTLRLSLCTTEYDKQVIDKRFRAVFHVHNVMVKHAMKLLRRLERNDVYQMYLSEYKALLKREKLSKKEKHRKAFLSKEMNQIRTELGLSQSSFESYLKVCAKQFKKCLSSQQVQKEAIRVWVGVEKILFSDGKRIHFKKVKQYAYDFRKVQYERCEI